MKKTMIHSSVQSDERVRKYISSDCKYYYLPLFEESFFSKTLQNVLGCCNNKNRSDIEIQSSIIKAQKSRSSHIKIPLDRIDDRAFAKVISLAQNSDLGMVFQISSSMLTEPAFLSYLFSLPQSAVIECIIESVNEEISEQWKKISIFFKESYLSLVIQRSMDWRMFFNFSIFKDTKEVYLYFGYQKNSESQFLSCKESYQLLKKIKEKFPQKIFLPPKGVDLWDFRARHDFDMEPFYYPCLETQSNQPEIKYSVIIPTFNNQNHLRVVLDHLYKQNVGLDSFEVIVVDDGGTDETQTLVLEQLSRFQKPMNFRYIFFPRVKARVMGDSQYRAGIARNLGAKNARGDYFCFLDSDIVIPPYYLEKVGEKLEVWGATQAKRVNLKQEVSHLGCLYADVDSLKDTFPDEPYWEDFIKTKDWHQVPYNWKYVCTHSFSLKKDVFWEVGGLKKNFIYYGFEDTDLGYRLVKAGYQLHLLDLKVYHLFHENERSEFMNLKSLRHQLLSRTAQIFYLHHLDSDIYENLIGFMNPEPSLKRSLGRVKKIATLGFLRNHVDPVFKSLPKG